MFETLSFRRQLRNIMIDTTKAEELIGFDPAITRIMQALAVENEDPVLPEDALKRALGNARVLSVEACRISKSYGKRIVKVEHFVSAYKRKFCSVWPFCR